MILLLLIIINVADTCYQSPTWISPNPLVYHWHVTVSETSGVRVCAKEKYNCAPDINTHLLPRLAGGRTRMIVQWAQFNETTWVSSNPLLSSTSWCILLGFSIWNISLEIFQLNYFTCNFPIELFQNWNWKFHSSWNISMKLWKILLFFQTSLVIDDYKKYIDYPLRNKVKHIVFIDFLFHICILYR